MNLLAMYVFSRFLIFGSIVDRFNEGGPLMMSLILICFVMSLFFLARGFMGLKGHLEQSQKMLRLAIDSSLLGLVVGFMGSIIGLIMAFDSIEAMGDAEPAIFAGGLKVSLLTATFGLFTFVVCRLGILVLRGLIANQEPKA
ncbi:MotA/TolQ/ExbB proton channel family protein [Mangrovimonas sp. TPBH4]|uniref:MotA/TolQ/ExbB proton channel family protein n=1 Tax=Mangrovimonas sp. TPBH4 TaxID=1645914 RepID=UPI0006B6804E|nr:MotA/TolQ/ExbB proton channel family protein [Mangrovimonas sp. TPBH4]